MTRCRTGVGAARDVVRLGGPGLGVGLGSVRRYGLVPRRWLPDKRWASGMGNKYSCKTNKKHTASRKPLSSILFEVISTLPDRSKSYLILSLYSAAANIRRGENMKTKRERAHLGMSGNMACMVST